MDEDRNRCSWSAFDFSDDPPTYRTFAGIYKNFFVKLIYYYSCVVFHKNSVKFHLLFHFSAEFSRSESTEEAQAEFVSVFQEGKELAEQVNIYIN